MKKKLLVFLIAVTTLCSACGNSSSKYAATTSDAGSYNSYDTYMYDDYAEEYATTEEALVEYEYDETAPGSSGGAVTTSENATTTNRKLIRNVNLSVETKEYDSLMITLEQNINEAGGYIEYLDVYNGSPYNSSRNRRTANITARVPANKLNIFLGQIGEVANITNKTESVRDVTLSYVDMESHKNMLIAERDNLMKLLEGAETIEDMITVEDRLTDIRYQIDSMESQLRTYDNQVDYSTVVIYISEVISYSPVVVEEQTAWERICEGFVESLEDVGNGIKEFFIGFIIAIPYLVVWAVVITIIVVIFKCILRTSKKYRSWSDNRREARKAKKEAKKAAKIAKKNGEKNDVTPAAPVSDDNSNKEA